MCFKILIFTFVIMGITIAEFLDVSNSSQEPHKLTDSNNYDDGDNCLQGCPRILDPICAVDEKHPDDYKYFHNQCLMDNDNCRQDRAWKPTQMLMCIKDVDPLLRDDCMRACPLIYNPVCASDGKSYEIFGNRCSFGMENCLASGKWLEVQTEQCGL